MPDYKAMYFQLFNCISDAVELLQQGQLQTEESYISQLPPRLDEQAASVPDEGEA